MAFHTFGPGLALDRVTMAPLPAVVASLEDAETGEPVQAFSMDDESLPVLVATNRYGYFGQFKVPAEVRRLRLTFAGLTLEHTAWELIPAALDQAVAARNEAELAKIAAQQAAALVAAPADTVVKTLIQGTSTLTRQALDALYMGKGTLGLATPTADGLMPKADKAKLDGLGGLATSAADGLMPKADKAKLDAAAYAATADTIARRNSAGNIRFSNVYLDSESAADDSAARRGWVKSVAVTQDLGGGIDLNTLQDDRFYRQGSTANATLANNYPIARAGHLAVRNLTNMTFQEYTVYSDSPDAGRKFWRGRYNSIWSPWREVADVASVTALQNALTAANGQITQLQQTTPSIEELCATGHIAVGINGTTPVTEFDWSANFSTFIAPFPLRILSVDLMFDRWALAANNTNYATIILRRVRAGSFTNIATKTTQATGGEAIAMRTAWGYAGATWDTAARDFQAGDAVNFAFSFTGTGVKAVLPMSATVRYMPL